MKITGLPSVFWPFSAEGGSIIPVDPVFTVGLGDQFPPMQFPRRQFPSRQFPRQRQQVVSPFVANINPRGARLTVPALPSFFGINPTAAQLASSS